MVITSVDRDDLRDGGARHFADCLGAMRASSPATRLEILVPDFRGRLDEALDALSASLPDVLNHNLETVPRLYKLARPGADYAHSLKLLRDFKARFPDIPTKSGLMLGLGETDEEVLEVMRDLRAHDVDMLTIGQYLQPSDGHLPVLRYAPPESFAMFEQAAQEMGFSHAAFGPMVVRRTTPIARRKKCSRRRPRSLPDPLPCAPRHTRSTHGTTNMTGRRVIAVVALAACAVSRLCLLAAYKPAPPAETAHSGATAPAPLPDSPAAGRPARPAGSGAGAARTPTVPVLAHTTQPMHDLPPFKLPAGALAAVLPDLKAAAEHGDANAAFTAYALLRDCAQQDTMAAARASVIRSQPPDSPVVVALNEDMAATAARCSGVPKPTIDDQLPLEKAAAGGNPYAQAAYANDALTMMRADPDWMLRNPDEVSRIENTGLDYLQQSANGGDRAAMKNLGIAYSSGGLAQPDPVLAYAYLYASTNLGTSAGSETLIDQFAAKLNPEELARAQTLAQQLRGQ